jgi:hypothetical protein
MLDARCAEEMKEKVVRRSVGQMRPVELRAWARKLFELRDACGVAGADDRLAFVRTTEILAEELADEIDRRAIDQEAIERLTKESLEALTLVKRLTETCGKMRAARESVAKDARVVHANWRRSARRVEMAGAIVEAMKRGNADLTLDDILTILDAPHSELKSCEECDGAVVRGVAYHRDGCAADIESEVRP